LRPVSAAALPVLAKIWIVPGELGFTAARFGFSLSSRFCSWLLAVPLSPHGSKVVGFCGAAIQNGGKDAALPFFYTEQKAD